MLHLSQSLRLEQRLTPQQILLSTLLQLPLLSLEQKIKSELEINPVLEEGEEKEVSEDEIVSDSISQEEEIAEELQVHDEDHKQDDDYDRKELEKAQDDTEIENIFNDEDSFEIRIPRDKNHEEYERPEISLKSLPEHLMEQLYILPLKDFEFVIGEYLIWNVRDDGYLDSGLSLEHTAEIFNTEFQAVEKVLKSIQRLDPAAVGSRDLRECLMVQLEDTEETDTLAYLILRDHFENFINKRFNKVLNDHDISKEELQKAINRIQKLNPKPGEGMFDSRSNYVVPDFMVEKIEGKFEVTLNDWNVPPLRISNAYKKMLLDKKKTSKETRQYIRQKVESARWFINSIYQRKLTMLKVMEAIIVKQYDFFEKGPEHIEPLIMKEIAEIISMDISTVSRVANGKYVQCDWGVFELKYFFNERIENDDGEEISTRKIKNRIREIIEEENSKKPHSDDKLSAILKTEGFPIARRTVAKYREQLQIPVARLRRGI